MDVLRRYEYLLFELTQVIKGNKSERPFSYKVKLERTKLRHRANKKKK